jgi:DNA repair exonuclease SbcCD ATPase subunit
VRFLELRITAFGPLENTTLPFVDGMNVLYGPNESAKTSVHAALFAGLCGIRRAQGQPEREDRAFEARHRPWDHNAWEVSLLVQLADGRRVRLTHDLASKVGSKAVDEDTGRDLSTEILFEGSIDGSAWLGLNRRSFRATACVRQAEIVAALATDDDHRRDHSALQQALQRAATAAGQRDETAAAALKRLEDFWRENVGLDDARSAKRPYRRWKGEVESREEVLREARTAHEQYLGMLAERDEAAAARDSCEHSVKLAEAAVLRQRADGLEEKAHRAEALRARYPAEPGGVAVDQALAGEVTQALTLWEAAPPAQTLNGKTSGELAQELADLPERPSGELTPAQEVLEAGSDLATARNLQREHATLGLEAESGGDQPVMHPRAVHDPLRAWRRARIPMIAVGCFALAGVVAVALGSVAIGAVLLVAAVAVAGASFWFLRPTAAGEGTFQETRPVSVDRRSAWEARNRELQERVEELEQAFLEALARHGVEVGAAESPIEALHRYKLECSSREEQDRRARQRDQLTLAMEQRKHAEEQRKQRDGAIGALTKAAGALGLAETDPERIAATLREWQSTRDASSQAHDEAQREWSELEQLLNGRTLGEMQGEASAARSEATAAAVGFSESEVDALDASSAETELPGLRQQFHEASDLAARRAQLAESEGAKLKGVAEAEAELDEAEAALAHVAALSQTLETAIAFLKEAQRRVYESIAPALTSTLEEWLPRVALSASSGGVDTRYNDAYIDPEGLEVRVRRDDGPWRDAEVLSAGTREQIYLLLRVALAQHLTTEDESIPLLLDEITAQCDSTRRKALLDLLLELSRERQIVLFTHEDSVYEWASASLSTEAVKTLSPVK